MKREELIKLFDNDKTRKTTVDGLLLTDKLIYAIIKIKGNSTIYLDFKEDEKIYIDCTNDRYVGLGSNMIMPIKNIEDIDIRWK